MLKGDCLKVLPLLEPACVDLVLTDPPYGIGKAHWDNIASYSDFIMDRFKACEPLMKRRATLWFTHMIFDTLADLNARIKEEMGMVHKQLIPLDKGLASIAGRTSDILRSFPRATEYLQFYVFPEITNPMAYYLQSEIKRAGATNRQLAELFPSKTGGMTGCVSNWLTGANFPTKLQYLSIKVYLGAGYLEQDYDVIRKKYEAMRYVFNLPVGFTDVWQFDCNKSLSVEHDTPKPLDIWLRIIAAATNKNALILDPFLGSGTTAIAAKMSGCDCIAIERDSKSLDETINGLKQGVLFHG